MVSPFDLVDSNWRLTQEIATSGRRHNRHKLSGGQYGNSSVGLSIKLRDDLKRNDKDDFLLQETFSTGSWRTTRRSGYTRKCRCQAINAS